MGSLSYKVEEGNVKWYKRLKACIAWLATLLISMVGGVVLGCWEMKYHPTNSELWMVPFGLILFLTPLIVSFSVFFSDVCNSKEDADVSRSQDNPIHDPEK